MRLWGSERTGLFWGALGVLGFSLTLPATQVAVSGLNPTLVGFGRATVAGVLAAVLLTLRRETFPRQHFGSLVLVMLAGILGFPWLSTWALAYVPATHGAIVLALLPLATAGMAAWRNKERPSWQFWAAGVLASATVITYALVAGAGRLVPADAALLGAVFLAALGYAEGGRLSRILGGWRVISWALVLSLPVTAWPVISAMLAQGVGHIPWSAWLSFAYLSVGSQFLAFFSWYQGLAIGGVARISQIQYLQVFLTLGWSAWLLHEAVTPFTGAAALLVIMAVIWSRGAPVYRPEPPEG